MIPLLLASVVVTGGEGVPEPVLEMSRALVARALAGAEGTVRLEMHRTRDAMHRAVGRAGGRVPDGATAWYHFASRTIFAWMAPRPAPVLFDGRLPGLLAGALAHEAQHARAHLLDPAYPERPRWRAEGEAERDAIAFLRDADVPGGAGWELLARSRVERGKRFFLDPESFRRIDPDRLGLQARTTWYAQAWVLATGDPGPAPPWIVHEGFVEPLPGGYRLLTEKGGHARILQRDAAPLRLDVTILPIGAGRVDLVHSWRSETDHALIRLDPDGVARAVWVEGGKRVPEPSYAAPVLPRGPRIRISLDRGTLRVNGAVTLYVRQDEGRSGIGIFDGVADIALGAR